MSAASTPVSAESCPLPDLDLLEVIQVLADDTHRLNAVTSQMLSLRASERVAASQFALLLTAFVAFEVMSVAET